MIVGIDPGKRIGVVMLKEGEGIEHRCILSLTALETLRVPPNATIVVGNGTGHDAVCELLARRQLTYQLIDEAYTTLQARDLFFAEHPPRGLARLLPRGLRTPPRPIDDYAAYAIARRYVSSLTPKK